jgi:hypothetical protein
MCRNVEKKTFTKYISRYFPLFECKYRYSLSSNRVNLEKYECEIKDFPCEMCRKTSIKKEGIDNCSTKLYVHMFYIDSGKCTCTLYLKRKSNRLIYRYNSVRWLKVQKSCKEHILAFTTRIGIDYLS